MKYMFIIADAIEAPAPTSAEFEGYMKEWIDYTTDMAQAGVLRAGDPLMGVDTATTVRVADGAKTVHDGPFIETKEVIGGYYIVDVDTLDDALEWAKKMPLVKGSIEVRPVAPTGAPN